MIKLIELIKKNKNILLGIFTFLFTASLLILCFRKIDLQHFWLGIREVKVAYLLIAASLTCILMLLHTIQLKLFLPKGKKISFKRLFENYSVFSMMVNLLPFWGGHALFVYLLGHREKVGKTATVSMMTLEQITEGFGKLFIFGWVALYAPIPEWMSKGMSIILIVILLAYVILFYLAFRFRDFEENDSAPHSTLFQKITHFFKTWAYHLHTLRSLKKTAISFSIILLIKLIETFSIYLVQRGFGIELSIHSSFLVMAALGISGMLPITPAQLGVFEATALLIYRYLGLDATHSVLIGFFAHLVRLIPFVLIGYICSWKIGFRREEMQSQDRLAQKS